MLTALTPNAVPSPAPTVLVVDDVADARDMMARLLRYEGYKSLTAEDGESALDAVRSYGPDLILLDLTMPDMDGLEVLRRLRDDPRLREVPVVMFSAIRDPRLVAEAKRLGAADYVVKGSVGSADLMARLARHLPHGWDAPAAAWG